MQEVEVKRILDLSGFKRGRFPFTYLGVPINTKKLSKEDGDILIDKMTARIRSWSSKNLSYAGRCVLINSVLMTIQSYWSQLMIIPKKLTKEINAICRAFLWKGKSDFVGPGAVSWSRICSMKKAGGLGIRNLNDWNKAAMYKHIWAIENGKESLWLMWINHIYLKYEDIWGHVAPQNSSWQWRKIVELKNEVQMEYKDLIGQAYSISKGYRIFSGMQQKVKWNRQVWSKYSIPKHNVIFWLVMLKRLNTCDRIEKFMSLTDAKCKLCNEKKETHNHLFFECKFSAECFGMLKTWLGWRSESTEIGRTVRWLQRCRLSNFKKLVFNAGLAAVVYMLW